MPTNSPRPFQLTYPLNARQVEEIDSMFQKLFSKLPLGVGRGGTGLSFGDIEVGDLLYGDLNALADPILSTLSSVSVGSYLRSGGILTAPLWSTVKIPNTAAVGDMWIASAVDTVTALAIGAAGTVIRSNGTIPANSSFTIPNTFAQGDVIYASATNVLTALAKSAVSTQYLANTGASNAPVWDEIDLTTGVSGVLPEASGGTGQATWSAGDVVYAPGANNLAGLATSSTSGTYMRSNGTLPFWSTLVLPNTATAGGLMHASTTNNITLLAIGTAGKVLRSTGTLPAWSTFTIPDTYAQGDILYASAASVFSALVKDTNATRYLSNTGASNNPAWAQVALTTGVSGVLPTANGGTNADIASAALVLGSGQLSFPATQNASADANTLDDYEEGTYTPTIGGTTSESGQVYAVQTGNYIKVGKLVIAWHCIQLSTLGTITGQVILKGLPFTAENLTTGAFATAAMFWASMTTAYVIMQANVIVNTTTAFVLTNTAAATSLAGQPVQADLTANTIMRACLVYKATA